MHLLSVEGNLLQHPLLRLIEMCALCYINWIKQCRITSFKFDVSMIKLCSDVLNKKKTLTFVFIISERTFSKG